MALIQGIREKVAAGTFEFSQHATDQSILRHIRVQEIREAIAVGEVIEDYPNDKYGPSCLILGFTGTRAMTPNSPFHLTAARLRFLLNVKDTFGRRPVPASVRAR